jgi:uncharacterized lipoprotein YddW (UPF0748 family)
MKTGISLALAFFASAMLLAAAETYQPVSIVPPSPPREFRGAWIATVANKDWPSAPGLSVAQQKAELISLLDTAVRLKLNAVIFQVRPSCDAVYASSLEPWSYYLTGVPGAAPQPYYDPLAFAIEEAHKRGLEIHAWFNPFRARLTPAEPLAATHIARTHPDWVRSYGDQLWLDPGNPGVRDYVVRIVTDVVRRYDVDGVQFDDYFYPYPVPGRNGYEPFPDGATWARYGVVSGLTREDWRRQNINQFVQSVYLNIKAVKPWVKFGISPFGIWRPGNPPQIRGSDAYATLFADSRLWLARGWVDYLSPQLYWPIETPEHSYTALLNWWAQQNVQRRNLWPGLAAYQLPSMEIAGQIQATRRQPGASGEILFHLKSLLESPALANAIAGQYTQPVLVPASPWLAALPPSRPQFVAHESGVGWMFQWATPGYSPARWMFQYYGPDNNWTTKFLPAFQTTQVFAVPPPIVSVRAMDRAGNLGPPTVLGKTGAAVSSPSFTAPRQSIPPAAVPASNGSFWNSYKGK